MTAALLALGVVLYPSTQLRFGGLPIGPGEILLVGWMGLQVAGYALGPAPRTTLALKRVATFWTVLILALCVGTIVGFLREPFQDYAGIAHDLAAYILLFAFSMLIAMRLADAGLRRAVVWRVAVLGALSMLLQIASGYGLAPVPGVDPWYFDRLRGWSLDPNQLGLFAVFLTLLAVHLAETAERPRTSLAALGLAVPPLAVGVLSQSDTFVVALTVAASLLLALKAITWIGDAKVGPTLRGAAVVLVGLALPLMLVAAVPFWSAAVAEVEQKSAEVYADDNQGDTRINLWKEAIEKGLESGLVGYGFGPHLTSKSFKRPPPDKFEAHNTSLDLFTQGGLVALFTFVWLALSTFATGWSARLPALAALTAAIAVFSMFHFVVRHPIFWFGIVLCLLEAARVFKLRAQSGEETAG